MSEQHHYGNLPSDHLWSLVEHSQAQIDMWVRRQQIILGHLALRGDIAETYPDDLSEQL